MKIGGETSSQIKKKFPCGENFQKGPYKSPLFRVTIVIPSSQSKYQKANIVLHHLQHFLGLFFLTILNLPSKYSFYLSTVMRFINFSSFHHEEEPLLAFLQHFDGGLSHLRQAGLAFEAVLLDLSVALVLHVVPVEDTCKSH